MTIFQKMLLVPVLSLILYSGFIIYSYSEHRQSNQKVVELRDNYLPLLEVANQNIQLFKEIRDILKDAVLAGEANWLNQTTQLQQQIQHNFEQLEKKPGIVKPQDLLVLKENFQLYYSNAKKLAAAIINDANKNIDDHSQLENVERYHNLAVGQFESLKSDINQHFRNTIDNTNQALNQLLFWGSAMAIILMLFLVIATLIVSLHTRASVRNVVSRMKALAQGSTDFSQRLVRHQRDELGYLIYWFNKLSDKLEQDYLRIENISITDNLTQLNNRTRTDSYFPQVLAAARHDQSDLCLVVADIDYFKKINDTHGHLAGDDVLVAFASILRNTARGRDFIARWGGEEFILILTNTSLEQAALHVEHIRQQVLDFDFNGMGPITASFGVAMANPQDTPNSLMQRADECLYAAKQQGRNRVVIETSLAPGRRDYK